MYSEARKLEVLTNLKKVKDEDIWIEVEKLVNMKLNRLEKKKKPNIHALVDLMTLEEVELMEKAIEETVEIIYHDEWK
jgi:hypothetical protein